jgi:hypothetical protein
VLIRAKQFLSGSEGVGGEGKGREREGRLMTQSLYAHMNKGNKKIKISNK